MKRLPSPKDELRRFCERHHIRRRAQMEKELAAVLAGRRAHLRTPADRRRTAQRED